MTHSKSNFNRHLKFKKVCVVGLGEVGLPTAEYIKHKGLLVFGYDLSERAVTIAKGKGIAATTQFQELPYDIDAYVICVSTLLSENMAPDLSPVFDVCVKIAGRSDHLPLLVSIESTIIPGTSLEIYDGVFRRRIALVHVPHRYWSGDPVNHGVRQLRIIGAVDERSIRVGLAFYRDVLDIPLHVVSSIKVAEMCKIVENAYRYVCIAFSEELSMICDELGLNFDEVREACNTKWNIDMLEARVGIGGHCLPKDIRYLISLSKYSNLLKSAISVDGQYRKWLRTKHS
jgi:UDP-N-acetyl-D-mannosaminuronic acid dehydrogenase